VTHSRLKVIDTNVAMKEAIIALHKSWEDEIVTIEKPGLNRHGVPVR